MSPTVITTASGRKVDYLKPRNINLKDIALGLSRQPRYAGQTTKPYSVAQHCLLVAELIPKRRLYALIHDAPEALLCDMPTPAKDAMRELGSTAYDELEWRLYAAICKAVKLEPRWFISIKFADNAARGIEARLLHPKSDLGKGVRLPAEIVDRIFNLPDGGREAWLNAVTQEMKCLKSQSQS